MGAPRIGITMRRVQAQTYLEARDALAEDWGRFMRWALPEALWLPVPNLGEPVLAFARGWGLNGLILSGGEDLGATPERDATERALLARFHQARMPVLGVCRGMELMWAEAGGSLVPVEGHAGTRHFVRAMATCPGWEQGTERREVNSYHRWGLGPDVPQGLLPWCRDAEGRVEALMGADSRRLGVMWHPEREAPFSENDRRLVRWLFGMPG